MPSACRTVYYDKSCPLCSAEIGHYQGLAASKTVEFVDVSVPQSAGGADLGTGLTQSLAMSRFHVRDETGALHSGAAAFVQLWSVLPGWRYAAKAARVPGALWILEALYKAFLPVRPTLARIVRRIGRSQPTGAP